MKVLKVTPRGFCLGVVVSIKMAKDTVKAYPDKKIYMIGLLVHNKIIVKELEELGIIAIDDWKKSRLDIIKTIPKGSVVIFSAHGTDLKVLKVAEEQGLIIVDTKCEWVLETENIIKKYLNLGFDIVFIGKHDHPETIALTSLDNKKIHLVTNTQEVENLSISNKDIFITNQTTLSIIDTDLIYKKIKEKYENAIFKNDICEATLVRQQAVLDLDPKEVDLLYVVGDERSNNTMKLVELALNKGINSIRINRKEEIEIKDLKNINTVAVTAGASTSSIIQNQVIKYLEELKNETQ
ncbi:4-hydroxy-3-methylbut-2-enyl diphosphate reductase [Spiroplasma cantharicola]|uniref:4-hydroxy-3-methylbut-2-enyl diphosphate reductase n=1 Tax=Spiroplasma cantharicola TaxID=362837 RepID=A0A0M3SJF1_9MOLU|nr:4-hydroxy-3-methylbut-2-enyl diphosphate reductase [Spiroplasma cantharicola]ALD66624.1 4-hydroxy-3-methylbut-2-enyl diphosphate reductase [Spiroplasma cantharicola]